MRYTVGVLGLIALLGGCQTTSSGSDPRELQRTWEGGRLYIPATPGQPGQVGGFGRIDTVGPQIAKLGREPKYPAIVYVHGCSGRGVAARTTGEFLAKAGYLVVQPDSFARAHKPQSCDPRTRRGGMHRDAGAWRRAETVHAVRRVRQWPFIDPRNVFLFGFSQGGLTVATVTGVDVRARVIEGWTCRTPWTDNDGLNAPAEQPVLALVAERDPWFHPHRHLAGDCGHLIDKTNGSASHVFTGALANKHHLLAYPNVQKIVLDFLGRHRMP